MVAVWVFGVLAPAGPAPPEGEPGQRARDLADFLGDGVGEAPGPLGRDWGGLAPKA